MVDEFQDFYRVNKAVFSEMQNIWDEYERSSRINLIVCGSIYSMMQKIFKDKKEPLYGSNTRSEIEDVIGREVGGHLTNLEKEYVLITKRQPLFEISATKNVRYELDDVFYSFWFRFVFK